MDVGTLQTHYDRLVALSHPQSAGALQAMPFETAAVTAQAAAYVAVFDAVLPTVDAGNGKSLRLSAVVELLDVTLLCARAGLLDDAERWLATARRAAAGTKYEAPLARAAGMPAWFLEAWTLRWMVLHERPDAEIERAEEAFRVRYPDRELRRFALG